MGMGGTTCLARSPDSCMTPCICGLVMMGRIATCRSACASALGVLLPAKLTAICMLPGYSSDPVATS